MSGFDWADPVRADEVVCQMVSPLDPDEVWGELEVTGASVSQGYYTDTRVSASVETLAWDTWVDGAWLRLTHRVRGTGYSRELFTGFAASAAPSLSGVVPVDPRRTRARAGLQSTRVELKSAIYAMSSNVWPPAFTVGAGARASVALARLCALDGRRCRFAGDFPDWRFTSTRAWDACSSVMSVCFDVCEACGARMGVDGHGVVEFSRYLEPSRRTAQFALDATAPDSLVLAGSVSGSSDRLSLPNRSAVVWKDGEEELIAWSDLPSSSRLSAAHRGWTRTEVHELRDMPEPRTQAHAQQLAASKLASDVRGTDEWECETLWWEAEAGMVGTFDPGDGGGPRRVMVKNVDSDLAPSRMTHRLTMKEV